MRISPSTISYDISFYSALLACATILIYLIKEKYLRGKYRGLMHVDPIYIFIYCCFFLYDMSKDVSTCEFFHDCYEGANDALLSHSYSYEVKESECPSNPGPLIDSFSDRHNNGKVELKHTLWADGGLASVCIDSPYGCCYISTHCDSMMKSHIREVYYSDFLKRTTGPHSLHFSSMNTYITQMDVNGTDCPQLDDLILDYLHKEEEQSLSFFQIMIGSYLISSIVQLLIICSRKKQRPQTQYSGITEQQSDDGQKLRGSA